MSEALKQCVKGDPTGRWGAGAGTRMPGTDPESREGTEPAGHVGTASGGRVGLETTGRGTPVRGCHSE